MIGIIILQIVLILLNAVFACAEIAVLSVNETRLERLSEDGNKRAKRLSKLIKDPAKFLATIQVAITLSGFLGSAFAADNFADPLAAWVLTWGWVQLPLEVLETIAVVVITLILSYFTLVFGELVPKRLAMKKSESIAMGLSGMVRGISVIFTPIVWFLSVSTNLILRLFGIDPHEKEEEVSEEEIRMMVDAGSESGTIEHQEKEFIQNVFEFNDITAGNILTHRTDVTMLYLEDEDEVWAQTIHKARHTLYPVCDESADNIIGILNAKDYFRLEDHTRGTVLSEALYPAYFVPKSIKADVLFRNMKETRNSLAIVVDEYGGMEGIVTLYDLIEELVGDLNEESNTPDEAVEEIEVIDENTWRIRGNVMLRELEDVTGTELVTEDYDTFTGLVFDAIGSIPEDGDEEITVALEKLDVTVKKIEAHQIEEAIVTRRAEVSADEEA